MNKVKVPAYVAEHIEKYYRGLSATREDVQEGFRRSLNYDVYTVDKVQEWILFNPVKYARAWFEGYEVIDPEKQLYYLKLRKTHDGYLNIPLDDNGRWIFHTAQECGDFKTKFTMAEIKAIDERFVPFAVLVEEDEA